jgi:hypothetical protein
MALVVLAALVAVLVIAVPAQAGKVKKGSSNMVVSAKYTTEILSKQVMASAVAPMTQKVKYTKAGNMYLWFRAPMVAKTGAAYSTYSPSTGEGVFYHRGSIRIVEGSVTPHKIFRAEGIRILALGKDHYQMSVTYNTAGTLKNASGSYVRVTLAESTHAAKITHKGKSYRIDGVQFKLTKAGHDAILATIGESLDMHKIIFDTDLLPILK